MVQITSLEAELDDVTEVFLPPPEVEIVPVRSTLHLVNDALAQQSRTLSLLAIVLGAAILGRLAYMLYKRYVRDWRDVHELEPLMPAARAPPRPKKLN